MLLNSGYFVLCHPTLLRLQETVAMHSIKLAMGYVVQKKLASAIRVSLKQFERSYSTLCLFCLLSPTPLRLQKTVATHSIKLAMGSAVQKKLASAIRVSLKHFERSYSTLCC